jgi:hypothetical protein
MSKYVTPPPLPDDAARMIDPDRGFLCMTSHWRPDPEAADPEMPGQKLSMSSYIPVSPEQACLCGSGRRYRDCCQPNPLWYPICPNPGGLDRGYSLVKPQKATFGPVDGDAIRERLTAERRLRCTETRRARGFWAFFGDPPVEDQYGILSFGDVELKHNRTLVVGAMSDLRMRVLLAMLQEVAGDLLGKPRMSHKPILAIDKATGAMRKIGPSRGKTRRKRGRR